MDGTEGNRKCLPEQLLIAVMSMAVGMGFFCKLLIYNAILGRVTPSKSMALE